MSYQSQPLNRTDRCLAVAVLLALTAVSYAPPARLAITNWDDLELIRQVRRESFGEIIRTGGWGYEGLGGSGYIVFRPMLEASFKLESDILGMSPEEMKAVNVLYFTVLIGLLAMLIVNKTTNRGALFFSCVALVSFVWSVGSQEVMTFQVAMRQELFVGLFAVLGLALSMSAVGRKPLLYGAVGFAASLPKESGILVAAFSATSLLLGANSVNLARKLIYIAWLGLGFAAFFCYKFSALDGNIVPGHYRQAGYEYSLRTPVEQLLLYLFPFSERLARGMSRIPAVEIWMLSCSLLFTLCFVSSVWITKRYYGWSPVFVASVVVALATALSVPAARPRFAFLPALFYCASAAILPQNRPVRLSLIACWAGIAVANAGLYAPYFTAVCLGYVHSI